jgi:hypothetical protein
MKKYIGVDCINCGTPEDLCYGQCDGRCCVRCNHPDDEDDYGSRGD